MNGSIAAIITIGLGTWGTPSLLLTLGYGIGEQQQDGDTISAVWGDVEHSLTWADRGNLTGAWATLSNTAT